MTLIRVPDCSLGVNTDLNADELPLGVWSDARNMRFAGGFASAMRGIAQLFTTPSFAPYFVCPYAQGSNVYWVHAGLANVSVDNGTTRTSITGTAPTGGVDDRWSGGVLGGVLVLNNGVDQPQYWGGTGTLAVLPGWNAAWRAACIRPWRNFLVALDVTKSGTRYPHMLKLSDAAPVGSVPSSWDATNPALDALERDLGETTDYMVDAIPLGDALVVYKQASMYLVRETFDNNVISSQRIPGSVGMLSRGCGAATPVGHVVLTAGDVVIHQGQGAQSIADSVVRRTIFAGLDSTNFRRAFVTANPTRNEVWVCFPEMNQTDCTRAAVWNWQTKLWTFRTLPNLTYADFGAVPTVGGIDAIDNDPGIIDSDASIIDEATSAPNELRMVCCRASTPMIGLVEAGNVQDFGSTVSSYVERRGISLDDGQTVKLLTRVRPRIKGPAGQTITITVGGAMVPDQQAYEFSTPVNFTIGVDHEVPVFATGRYLYVRFASSGIEWSMRGYDLDVKTIGAY